MSFNLLSVFRSKILLIFIALIFVLIIPIGLYFFILTDPQLRSLQNEGIEITNQYPDYISEERVNNNFLILKNKDESEKNRYTALSNLAFFFGSGYSDSNDPRVRNFVLKLGEYANKNYPNQYVKANFNPFCQDSTCGPKIPTEITNLINDIDRNSKITESDKLFIIKNLQNTAYMEEDDPEAKFYFYLQTYIELSNQASVASTSSVTKLADDLKTFIKAKYPKESEGL